MTFFQIRSAEAQLGVNSQSTKGVKVKLFEQIRYCVALRKKPGEMLALQMVRDDVADRILPRLIFAPPPQVDPAQSTFLEERIVFDLCRQLENTWLYRPLLVDISFVIDAYGIDFENWLSPALKGAAMSGYLTVPCVSLALVNDSYFQCLENSNGYSAIVINLEEAFEQERLVKFASDLGASGYRSRNCVVVVDLSDADFSNPETAAPIMAEVVESVAATAPWAKIVVQGSNYPEGAIPAEPNSVALVHRGEWITFRDASSEIGRTGENVVFGDFGADHGRIDFKGGGRARPYLRYAIDDGWMIVRGANDRRWLDEMKIVAGKIVSHKSFGGTETSNADAMISKMGSGQIASGKPFEWRALNMCRHISKVIEDIGRLEGFELEKQAVEVQANQEPFL
jgi:hypothetical protein